MNRTLKGMREDFKEWKADVKEFAWKHTITTGAILGMTAIYLAIVIPGNTTHKDDKLVWVPKNDQP